MAAADAMRELLDGIEANDGSIAFEMIQQFAAAIDDEIFRRCAEAMHEREGDRPCRH